MKMLAQKERNICEIGMGLGAQGLCLKGLKIGIPASLCAQ